MAPKPSQTKKQVTKTPASNTEPSPERALSPKQAAFVQEYLIDFNATQAAIRAGYSKNSANEQASRMLAKANIQAEVQKAMKARETRTHITQDRVLQELARLAFVDLRKAYNEDGSLKLPNELDDDTAAAMAGLETLTTNLGGAEGETPDSLTTKKVKIFDKKGALELCMRHLGMLNDKLTVDATVQGTVSYRANMPRRVG